MRSPLPSSIEDSKALISERLQAKFGACTIVAEDYVASPEERVAKASEVRAAIYELLAEWERAGPRGPGIVSALRRLKIETRVGKGAWVIWP